jgi:uncharacterized protein (DUF488 family)
MIPRVNVRGPRSPHTARVASIGYERRSLSDFIQSLLAARVRKLLDVRAVATSRRASFRKVALRSALAAAGIEYRHVPAAGNPYRDAKGDVAACLATYRRYLRRRPATVRSVAQQLSDGDAAVMCYERQHAACHRSVLLELIAQELALEIERVE